MTELAFWILSTIAVAAALLVVLSRNPVHSVMWLILAFFSGAGLFILLGAEFVALLLVIVYVGAVAVLFLFVVMMLDVDFVALKQGLAHYLPVGALVGLILIVELGLVFGHWIFADSAPDVRAVAMPVVMDVANTAMLGQVLYDKYIYLFQAAGIILLIAMIGAIVLTLRHRTDIKRQNVLEQMYRDPKTAVELRDVKSGEGV